MTVRRLIGSLVEVRLASATICDSVYPNQSGYCTMNSNKGFTLLELMVAIAIFAIVLSIALPNYTTSIASMRLNSDTESVFSAMQLARSEAVTRRASVSVSNFAGGTTVMQGATLIRTLAAPSTGIAISGAIATITYRADGSVAAPTNVSITGPNAVRTVCVNYIGQASIINGAPPCP